jgi:hypothetical protein
MSGGFKKGLRKPLNVDKGFKTEDIEELKKDVSGKEHLHEDSLFMPSMMNISEEEPQISIHLNKRGDQGHNHSVDADRIKTLKHDG